MKVTYRIKMPDPIPYTKEGYEKVLSDLEEYTAKRKVAIINLQTARAMGDLSENAAYKVARFELNDVDRKLRQLRYLKRFGVVTEEQKDKSVNFGNTITVSNGKKDMTFHLVNGYESNPEESKLSITSPIGRAIVNRKEGEKVVVTTPRGPVTYTIKKIK